MPVVFIRFNPDCFRMNNIVCKIPFKIRIQKFIKVISILSSDKNQLMPLNIVYLYYNRTDDVLDIFNDIDYPEELKKCIINI